MHRKLVAAIAVVSAVTVSSVGTLAKPIAVWDPVAAENMHGKGSSQVGSRPLCIQAILICGRLWQWLLDYVGVPQLRSSRSA